MTETKKQKIFASYMSLPKEQLAKIIITLTEKITRRNQIIRNKNKE
jgi:hypothetical protein